MLVGRQNAALTVPSSPAFAGAPGRTSSLAALAQADSITSARTMSPASAKSSTRSICPKAKHARRACVSRSSSPRRSCCAGRWDSGNPIDRAGNVATSGSTSGAGSGSAGRLRAGAGVQEGFAGASLIPLHHYEIAFEGGVLGDERRADVGRSTVEDEEDRLRPVSAADGDPLFDAAEGDESCLVDWRDMGSGGSGLIDVQGQHQQGNTQADRKGPAPQVRPWLRR